MNSMNVEPARRSSPRMHDLVRQKDWSVTPLGPQELWPQSLRTLVELCLSSSFPTVIFWGAERVQIYNDGYRVILGGKHPLALGQRASDCWAEIWDVIAPMMAGVFETGQAVWVEATQFSVERSGYLEEAFFTFSYTPARDESGEVAGIFETVAEVTSQVVAHRRLAVLRELGALGSARSVEEACSAAAATLAKVSHDVPFAMIYVLDDASNAAALRACIGIAAEHRACPAAISIDSNDLWHLGEALRASAPVVLHDLASMGPLPGGPWPERAHDAAVLPIERPGSSRPFGFLVVGASPRRRLDEEYLDFLRFIAQHLSMACSSAEAYDQARRRADALAELDRAKTAFFGNVSHEFRTPLTLILGPLEDALGGPTRSLRGESLESVHRSALRLLRLVNSLLDFSRIEAGRLDSSFEATDLPVLTGGLAGSFQSLVESAGMKLVVDCPPLLEPVYVDRSQWEKIVLNLVSNAFKFTFEGEIAVRLRGLDGRVELSVSDTGTGIPEHELPKVFERFHRVEGARGRSFEGTGIGLALVNELVQAHGGTVRVESVMGRGSTFFVAIPLGSEHLPKERMAPSNDAGLGVIDPNPIAVEARRWLPSADEAKVADATSLAPGPPTADPARRILVADDNADMRQYLMRLLRPHWEVVLVKDGSAALVSALAHPPDLVLSDVMMPRMDGVTLLRALREDPKTQSVPVVLLSARAGEEAVLEGLETGADDYLVKPFSARELLTRVRTHLAMARVRQAAADAALELARTRAVLLEEVARKNKELESFSYSVSHDLRAPLRSIDGFAQALIEDYATELKPKGLDYLRRVRAAAQRMGQLIDDLLNLSRVERAELVRQRVDLSSLAGRVADLLKRNEPDRTGEFAIEPGVHAEVDPRLMEIVLENLLGNAWKFTRGAARPRIEFGLAGEDDGTAFFVRDNGAGFNPAYASKMFTPFQRFHSDKEFPGTGIGLATVRRIVERHGGRIWAESAVGVGATFYWTVSSKTMS